MLVRGGRVSYNGILHSYSAFDEWPGFGNSGEGYHDSKVKMPTKHFEPYLLPMGSIQYADQSLVLVGSCIAEI